MAGIVVAAFYKFVTLDDYLQLRAPLLDVCNRAGVKGTLLLAQEGINGTIAGTREGIDRVLSYLMKDERFADLDRKESLDKEFPFYRMKVKLKKEIVTMGVEGIDPNKHVGTYVEAEDWNALISDPDIVLIDTRNDYEVDIGTFKGAENPVTENFRQFPHYVRENYDTGRHKKVAMYCTGGIRCEKASAFMLGEGFEEVYHLKGGILKYLETVSAEDSLWEGECFVFDNRVSVDQDLNTGSYDQCHGCRHPITEENKASPDYQRGVCCPFCIGTVTKDQRERYAERQKQVELAADRNEVHIGAFPPKRQS